jgi:hypothetical protein
MAFELSVDRGGTVLSVTYTSTFSGFVLPGCCSHRSLVHFGNAHPTPMTRDDLGVRRGQIRRT